MKKHFAIQAYGHVQGVFFRVSTKTEADRLGVTGTVRNCEDGSVCIEAEGEENTLEQFVKWCKDGPGYARVQRVDIADLPLRGYTSFDIIRGL